MNELMPLDPTIMATDPEHYARDEAARYGLTPDEREQVQDVIARRYLARTAASAPPIRQVQASTDADRHGVAVQRYDVNGRDEHGNLPQGETELPSWREEPSRPRREKHVYDEETLRRVCGLLPSQFQYGAIAHAVEQTDLHRERRNDVTTITRGVCAALVRVGAIRAVSRHDGRAFTYQRVW